ncbi:MAG: type II secretion system major pseudopilin GspG [Bdellovibrionales bacterium]|nr:type II secretion system major pseudopilin GspG [Bdellovibrionales bacterium]
MKYSCYKQTFKQSLFSVNTGKTLFFLLRKGMTLIEIMIVVAVIAALMGYVGKKVMDRYEKAKVSQAKILISVIEDALVEFNLDCGHYPKTLDDLISAPADCEEWGPESYMDKIPKDPWKSNVVYEVDESGDYIITSFGADRRPGGKGLKKDISSAD